MTDDDGKPPPAPPPQSLHEHERDSGAHPQPIEPPPGYDPVAAYGAPPELPPPLFPPISPDDAPILPPAYSEGDIHAAVGAPTRRRPPTAPSAVDEEERAAKRGRRTIALTALAVVGGLTAIAFVFLGRANGGRYLITCSTDHIRAEQGRAFPPWGSHPLTGAEWKPVPLPPNAECKERETDDDDELAKWYLDAIVEQAGALLTARNLAATPARTGDKDPPSPLDVASDELGQALLLARAPARRDQRKEIERLLGDVDYWRASIRLRDATAALVDAAAQFDTAAAQRPLHASDAASWGSFVRRVVDELKAGPNGAPPPSPTLATGSDGHVAAPMGSALPVEPDVGSAAAPPEATPDAGVASGGVLL